MTVINKLLLGCLIIFTTLIPWTNTSKAQEANKQKLAITDISKADEDFHIQGEYLGNLGSRRRSRASLGLQVVALGAGEFQGAVYPGGLPGYGWNGEEKVSLSGSRSESVTEVTLILDSEQYQIHLKGPVALVFSKEEEFLGSLRKIQRTSPTLHARPPRNAQILFNGQDADQFEDGRITEDGLLMTGTTTKLAVNDFHLHLEFRTPYMPYAKGQARGNSGVYIQRRYEVQILDSFGLKGEHNECGGLYRQRPPAVNMCLPPLSWQTYDIYFTAARWDKENKKTANAVITVYHNGFPIHYQQEITGKTGAGKAESPEALPIHLQNHGNPVRFANVWIQPGPIASPSDIAETSSTTRRRCLLSRILRR